MGTIDISPNKHKVVALDHMVCLITACCTDDVESAVSLDIIPSRILHTCITELQFH